jgi:hypothetical protein
MPPSDRCASDAKSSRSVGSGPATMPIEQEIGAVYIAEEEAINEDIQEIEDELDET